MTESPSLLTSSLRILFVSHEASRTGAPTVLLSLLRWLRQNTKLEFDVLLLRGGPLAPAFREVAHRCFLYQVPEDIRNIGKRTMLRTTRKLGLSPLFCLREIRRQHRRTPYRLIYANTCVTMRAIAVLKRALEVPDVLHLHELETAIWHYGRGMFGETIPHVDRFIAVSDMVGQNLRENWRIPADKIAVVPAFIADDGQSRLTCTRKEMRERLGIPQEAFVAGGCGPMGWIKGTDLFLLVARAVADRTPDRRVHFVWLGGDAASHEFLRMQIDARKLGLDGNVHVIASQPNPLDYFQAFDIFLLTSREDSFPLVCLENADLKKPIFCFENATGSVEYIDETCGHVSPYLDTADMAAAVVRFRDDPDLCRVLGRRIHDRTQKYRAGPCGRLVLRIIEDVAGAPAGAR